MVNSTEAYKVSKLGLALAVPYLLLALLVIASDLHTRLYNPLQSELAGLLSLVVTMPTSVLLVWFIAGVLKIHSLNSSVAFLVFYVLCAAINAWVLYLTGVLCGRLFRIARNRLSAP